MSEQAAEKMTNYQLQQLFTKAAALCEKLPYLLGEQFQMTAENGVDNVIGKITTAMEQVKAFEVVMAEKADEVCTLVDEHWTTIEAKHRSIRKLVSELPELELGAGNLQSHSIKELCDIAERFRHLPKDAWERVVELAGVIAKARA